MRAFGYRAVVAIDEAVAAAAEPETMLLAGGTNVVDLVKLEVYRPALLVDVAGLDLRAVTIDDKGARIGALVSNTALAEHPDIKQRWPALSEAILAGASPQLRNMATVGGNLLQRTRCSYYRDLGTPCNKREPGTGCPAIDGYNRMHAILGTSDKCIAAHPSDMCVALAALDATVTVRGKDGERTIAFEDLHLLPGDSPDKEFSLRPGEVIASVYVPAQPAALGSRYLKVRDRASYAFALVSAAAGLQLEGGAIKSARLALGGVGSKPWRARAAEQALIGLPPDRAAFEKAGAVAFEGARPRQHNEFKVELGKRTAVRALLLAAGKEQP